MESACQLWTIKLKLFLRWLFTFLQLSVTCMEPKRDARDMALTLQWTDWFLQAEIRQPKPSKRVSRVAQWLRISLPMQEMQVQCLGREDLLDKEMANPLVFLPEKSHEQRSLAGYSPWGHKLALTGQLSIHTHKHSDSGKEVRTTAPRVWSA